MNERYAGYAYAYPHKTAYRALPAPVALRELWAEEDRRSLFLYLHVPFCEMRCGFCNLFTTANPSDDLEAMYVDALERQACATADALPAASFARMAIGGGTPTFLSTRGLERLFAVATNTFGVDLARTPLSVETSPETATAEKLRLLHDHHVDRISIGVQSFVDAEAHAAGRAQRRAHVDAALSRIRDVSAASLNIDLIYGLPGQTHRTWLESLECALRYDPEELFLYPLYVREATGIASRAAMTEDLRPELYRVACDVLDAAGYEQQSMRMFRRRGLPSDAPRYCCQEDGMVGIGCGARSYTRGLHYSFEWAVGRATVREIIRDYVGRQAFDRAEYGFVLDGDEQRRRWTVQSLLQAPGVDRAAYEARFGGDVLLDFPLLRELEERGFADVSAAAVRLTREALGWSDAIGPALYSERTRALMSAYEVR